jgi:hypothetical protein
MKNTNWIKQNTNILKHKQIMKNIENQIIITITKLFIAKIEDSDECSSKTKFKYTKYLFVR